MFMNISNIVKFLFMRNGLKIRKTLLNGFVQLLKRPSILCTVMCFDVYINNIIENLI